MDDKTTDVPPRFWVGNLLSLLCALYAVILVIMSFALSDQTRSDMGVSTTFLLVAAAILLVLSFLIAQLAGADRQAAEQEAAQNAARSNHHSG
jgi:drug/metabolite transporter (DMT)-like permease